MPCMMQDVLKAMLTAADGIQEKGGTFTVGTEHRVSFYLGEQGRGLVVSEVTQVQLTPQFAAISGRDIGTLYTPYESVFAISVKPPKGSSKSRAGFA